MDDNSKAKKMIDAVQQVVTNLRAEGKAAMADQTEKAFKDVPVGSLAKLYDLVEQFPTRKAALASLGADA